MSWYSLGVEGVFRLFPYDWNNLKTIWTEIYLSDKVVVCNLQTSYWYQKSIFFPEYWLARDRLHDERFVLRIPSTMLS